MKREIPRNQIIFIAIPAIRTTHFNIQLGTKLSSEAIDKRLPSSIEFTNMNMDDHISTTELSDAQ